MKKIACRFNATYKEKLFSFTFALMLAFFFFCRLTPAFALPVSGDIFTHDPSRITYCDGQYYIYFTGPNCGMTHSSDIQHWTYGPAVLNGVPDWAHKLVPAAKGDWIWAPDVIAWQGQYYLFYSYSTFGSKTSVIGLVTSPTLDPSAANYHWSDQGLVVASNADTPFNAIDPCPVIDQQGNLWLTFGSWNGDHGGIQIVRLDNTTAKPTAPSSALALKQILGPEGSFIYFHDGYYYLFENEGLCCQGINSTYHIVMGRSRSITGPYIGSNDKSMLAAGGSVFLSVDGERFGPGCTGIFNDNGIDRVSFHYYDGLSNGRPTLAVETMVWGRDGWPRAGKDLAPGRYTITDNTGGDALTAVGTGRSQSVALQPVLSKDPDASQGWNVSSTGDGYFTIASLKSGLFVHLQTDPLDQSLSLIQTRWDPNGTERWLVDQTSDGAFRVVVPKTQNCIAVQGDQNKQLSVTKWSNTQSEEWIFHAIPTSP